MSDGALRLAMKAENVLQIEFRIRIQRDQQNPLHAGTHILQEYFLPSLMLDIGRCFLVRVHDRDQARSARPQAAYGPLQDTFSHQIRARAWIGGQTISLSAA